VKNEVVFLINSLGGGGAEGVCINLANNLVHNGWFVTLVVLHLHNAVRRDELHSAVELVILGKNHARSAFGPMWHFLSTRKPQKILVFNHQFAVLLVFLRFFAKRKFHIIARNINTLSEKRQNEDSFWHKYIVNILTIVFYRKVDRIIAQSDGMKKDLIKHYGFADSDIIKINNPLNQKIEEFLYKNGCLDYLKDNYLLYIGKLEKQKAFHYAIEAFAGIAGNYPGLHLKIVGKGSQEAELKQLVYSLGLSDFIDFEGYQQDIIHYYTKACATILTSLYEGFPNVLVESIALGTPVVAFDCPSGPGEIIQNGINGYLVRYQDIGHLVECLRMALDRQWDAKIVSSTAGKYSIANVLDQYQKVLSL
jgi:glycosyltransferase involved in cell wall biosynthesis